MSPTLSADIKSFPGSDGICPSRDLKSGTCPKCQGTFDELTLSLHDIQKNKVDKMGNRILGIHWISEEYLVYRTKQGVAVQFSDCRKLQREQREKYVREIGSMLCQLRFLTSQMAKPLYSLWKPVAINYYDHQIVQGMVLTLEGDPKDARDLLGPTLDMATSRLTNENRIRYLLSCFVTGLAIVLLGVAYLRGWIPKIPTQDDISSYVLAGMFGAIGAVFSIAMRVQTLELVPCRESSMNTRMGSLRILIGFLAGISLLLLLTSGIVRVFPATSQQSFGQSFGMSDWPLIAVIGLFSGFAERMVPNLLRRVSETVEPVAQATATTAATTKSYSERALTTSAATTKSDSGKVPAISAATTKSDSEKAVTA